MRDKTEVSANRERYGRLLQVAQETGRLWIAESADAVLILTNEEGEELILVWPSEDIARQVLSASPEFKEFQPVQRTLDRWLSTSTPNLIEDGVFVAASPDVALGCLKVPPDAFAKDLEAKPALQGSDIARMKRDIRRRRGRR